MRALSGLTPALSRRLQRQLLAHLPPAAARSLRRTLSLHSSHSPHTIEPRFVRSRSAASPSDGTETLAEPADSVATPSEASSEPTPDIPEPQCSTLPRLRRRSTPRESTPPILATVDVECTPAIVEQAKRSTERPLLSKYLTPERNLSLDESLSTEGSILSEPSYIAAYGASPLSAGGIGLRRHSLRSSTDQPRKRVSRFLRSDFFDAPAEENLYAKHRKEKEMETQKILKEIREKRNKSIETVAGRELVETTDNPQSPIEDTTLRKSFSPVSVGTGKERSRSTTPFFPILDNINEVTPDTGALVSRTKLSMILDETKQKPRYDENLSKESKLTRPKSYPVKTLESIDEPIDSKPSENIDNSEFEGKEKPKESKLMRPKSYPTSSPSPEKVYINRNIKREEQKGTIKRDEEFVNNDDNKTDIEVSFSITLPKKSKPENIVNVDSLKNAPSKDEGVDVTQGNKKENSSTLVIKKYQIVNNENEVNDAAGAVTTKMQNGSAFTNGDMITKTEDAKPKDNLTTMSLKPEESSVVKSTEAEASDKKGTIKKKIIRKVSSKSKTNLESGQEGSNTKSTAEKKKVSKKVKEKSADEDSTKSTSIHKKKSVLQSIGHKLEKFTSSKSSSPEKLADNIKNEDNRRDNSSKLNRLQREQSVPVNVEPPTESNLIKRAVTLTDVAALDNVNTNNNNNNNNKITVSKVLGLFKKFETKEKSKPLVEKLQNNDKNETVTESASDILDQDKPRRPTSLLLNGLGRKNNYGKTASDSVSSMINENEDAVLKKETEIKNIRNSLKLDFSKLPRVKKIVPTNPVIEPLIMNVSSVDVNEKKNVIENSAFQNCNTDVDYADTLSRSRSRSRSAVSNSEIKFDKTANSKMTDKEPLSPSEPTATRSHESITPEADDVVDRIRRKSFYSRFNEKKQRRKSNLVGPGATEYDPLARIHAPSAETKYDASPNSPGAYDLSPGLSVSSDQSPSTERYRSLFSELPVSTRSNLRFDNYGVNDKIDTYRSLDRNEFRKYPGSRSYLDYDQSPSYSTSRYSRTKSLLENSDVTEDGSLTPTIRDPLKYNRTISMYSPGNYATYRPKRTRNPAIILKESEKEPSPENILDKIRQRKNFSISVTRKPDEKESLPRSNVSSKGEGDSTECSKKVD